MLLCVTTLFVAVGRRLAANHSNYGIFFKLNPLLELIIFLYYTQEKE